MNQKLLRLPEVKSLTGLSRSTIYLQVTRGSFPKPVLIGKRSVAWVESEVADHIDALIEKRGAR